MDNFDERLRKQEGESDFEYYARIGMMKLDKETDLEWDELADICGIGESGTHWRKKMYGIKEAMEYYENKINEMTKEYYLQVQRIRNEAEGEVEDKRVKELQNKILQLKKEKEKIKSERNHVNSQVRIIARVEHLIECTKDDIALLNERKPLLGNVDLTYEESEREGVCLISDIHYGAQTDNILECYDPQICREKMNYYCSKVIQYGKENNIKVLNLFGLGDYITGLIHNINRFDSRLLITEQVVGVSELLAEFINELSKHFYVKYALIQGNHSRIIAQKDNSVYEENFTEFIRAFVVSRLKGNKNVEYVKHRDAGIIEMEIKGKKCLGIHGELDKDKNLTKLIEMFDYKVDYIMRGHFHQSKQFDVNKTVVINSGCFAGEDYSKNARLYNKPVQKFMIFTEDGMICCYDINLNNYKKEDKK